MNMHFNSEYHKLDSFESYDRRKNVDEKTRLAQEIVISEALELGLTHSSTDQFLQNILNLLISNTPWMQLSPSGGIFMKCDGKLELELRAAVNLHSEIMRQCANVEFGHCLCGRVAADQKPIHVQCVDQRHEVSFDGMKPHGHYNIPIKHGKELLGVLVLYLPHGHKKNNEEMKFLIRISNITTLGIINRRQSKSLQIASQCMAAESTIKSNLLQDNNEEAIQNSLAALIKSSGSTSGFIYEKLLDGDKVSYVLREYAAGFHKLATGVLAQRDINNLHGGLDYQQLFDWIQSSGATIFNNDEADTNSSLDISPFKNLLALPIHSDNETIGIIGLADRPQGYVEEINQETKQLADCVNIIFRAIKVKNQKEALISHLNRAIDEKSSALLNASTYEEALNSYAIVSVADSGGKIISCNDNFSKISGYNNAELIGYDHSIVNSGMHSREFFNDLWKTIKSGNIWKGEICNKSKDGTHYWVESTIVPFRNTSGDIDRYVSIRHDITDRKAAELASQRQIRIMDIIKDLQSSITTTSDFTQSIGAALIEASSVCGFINAKCLKIDGDSEGGRALKLLGSSTRKRGGASIIEIMRDVRILSGDDQADELGLLTGKPVENLDQLDVMALAGTQFAIPCVVAREIMGLIVFEATGRVHTDALTTFCGAIGEALFTKRNHDIHKQREMIAKIEARRDPLTKLANRLGFTEWLEERAAVEGSNFALMLIDLDRFKPINDVYGHATGDAVLEIVAKRIKRLVRDDSIVARLGGDEFALTTSMESLTENITPLAKRLLKSITAPIKLENITVSVGASIGVSTYPEHAKGILELTEQADAALYRAKEERGQIQFFDAKLDEKIQRKSRLEQELKLAIPRGEIVPYFQPLVNLSDKSIVGYEMLARWHNAELGNVSPSDFIPVAEEAGLINEMLLGMVESAMNVFHIAHSEAELAINISAKQASNYAFMEQLFHIVEEARFPPHRLEVEITESNIISDLNLFAPVLHSIRDMGAKVVLDDFGTGYSSINLLRSLPVDRLKIDASFVKNVLNNDKDQKLVKALIEMARVLNIEVLAEGIEDWQTAIALHAWGCQYGQGYLFGKAEPSLSDAVLKYD